MDALIDRQTGEVVMVAHRGAHAWSARELDSSELCVIELTDAALATALAGQASRAYPYASYATDSAGISVMSEPSALRVPASKCYPRATVVREGLVAAIARPLDMQMMATASGVAISDVGAGQIYTTLAAWWAASKGNTTLAAQARVHGPDDVGVVSLRDAAFTPTSAYPVKIFPADGEQHDGTRSSSGDAHIVASGDIIGIESRLAHVHIGGMRIALSATGSVAACGIYAMMHGSSSFRAEGNNVTFAAHTTQAYGIVVYGNNEVPNGELVLRNNLLYGLDANAPAKGLYVQGALAGNVTSHVEGLIENNSIWGHSSQSGQYGMFYEIVVGTPDVTWDLTSRNNVVLGSGSGFGRGVVQVGGGSLLGEVNHTHAVSSDASASEWGGSDHEINRSLGECCLSSDDLTPLADGVLDDTGENRYAAGNTIDAAGSERPRVGNFSRGALTRYQPGTGLHRFYQGDSAATIDYSTPIAELRETAVPLAIKNLDLTDHQPIWLAVRNVSSWGTEETNTHIVKRVCLDEDDGLGSDPLDAPREVTLEMTDSNQAIVGFSYRPPAGFAWPERFDIFSDGGTSILETDSPIASIIGVPGQTDYEHTLMAPDSLTRYAVRAASTMVAGPLSSQVVSPQTTVRSLAQPELL
jgi:hypothetical protein